MYEYTVLLDYAIRFLKFHNGKHCILHPQASVHGEDLSGNGVGQYHFYLCKQLINRENLIPEATNRKPTFLRAEALVDIATPVTQATEPGTAFTAIRMTPPVTVVANAVERTPVSTVTARKA